MDTNRQLVGVGGKMSKNVTYEIDKEHYGLFKKTVKTGAFFKKDTKIEITFEELTEREQAIYDFFMNKIYSLEYPPKKKHK